MVSAKVVELEKGTEPLRGDFTLSFRGQETVHLSYNSSAEQVNHRIAMLKISRDM